ncbi:MAG: hypothetical protein JSS57_07615 [Proteobacteria bacterium]|nr:hypothetical protein [Pseudomonadota bacterium]
MTGVFNVPSAGLSNVSLDEIFEHIKSAERDRVNREAVSELEKDRRACASVLRRMIKVADPSVRAIIEAHGVSLQEGGDLGAVDAAQALIGILNAIPEGRRRRQLLSQLRQSIETDDKHIKSELSKTDAIIDRLRCYQASTIEIDGWASSGLPCFRKPDASALHKFREALQLKTVFDPVMFNSSPVPGELPSTETAAWLEATAEASVFVIEHDWASAFRGAQDFDGGETRLPGEFCVFEMVIDGKHVLSFAAQAAWPLLQHAVRTSNGYWTIFSPMADANCEAVLNAAAAQVRAVVIALEAEVATADIVRAPHKLNRARAARGKLPLFDYHVVSLARRSRSPALERDPNAEPGTRRRLHFRRGHWRHYENHKTWIKWMLVGDPDLGFVDKHYRV